MKHVIATIVFSMLGLSLGCTCGPQASGAPVERERAAAPAPEQPPAPSGEAAEGTPQFQESAGGLAWHAEEPLISRRPSSPMRAAEYVVRDHADAELTVFHFGRDQGGSVESNVDRWVAQFQQPDGRASREVARVERTDVSGLPVTRVDVSGTFAGMQGMGAAGEGRPGWRMLGAIAEGPDGVVFFKLTGPEAAIAAAESAFDAMIASLHPTG